jgi:hypothetical protein
MGARVGDVKGGEAEWRRRTAARHGEAHDERAWSGKIFLERDEGDVENR